MTVRRVWDGNQWTNTVLTRPLTITLPSGDGDVSAELLAAIAGLDDGTDPLDPPTVALANSVPGVASRFDPTLRLDGRNILHFTVPDPSQKFMLFTDRTGADLGLMTKASVGTMVAGSRDIDTAGGSAFQKSDVGRPVLVAGAGPGGTDLVTTLTALRPPNTAGHAGTLAAPSPAGVVGAVVKFGSSTRRHLDLKDCTYITWDHLSILGPHSQTNPADSRFGLTLAAFEPEAGVAVDGSSDITISDFRVENVWGDCYNAGAPTTARRPRRIRYLRCKGYNPGRDFAAITNCDDIVISDYDGQGCAQVGIDMEPNSALWYVGNVHLLRGKLGALHAAVSITGSQPGTVGDVEIDDLEHLATSGTNRTPLNLQPNFGAGNLTLRNFRSEVVGTAESIVQLNRWATALVENVHDVVCLPKTVKGVGAMTAGSDQLDAALATPPLAVTDVVRVVGAGAVGGDLVSIVRAVPAPDVYLLEHPASTAVVGAEVARGALGVSCSDLPFTHSSGTTLGSAVVTDAAVKALDKGKRVAGPGIPAGCYVGTITLRTSPLISDYRLSSSPASQVDVLASATATVSLVLYQPNSTVGALTITDNDFGPAVGRIVDGQGDTHSGNVWDSGARSD